MMTCNLQPSKVTHRQYIKNRNNRRLFLFNFEMRFFMGVDAIFFGKKGAIQCD